MSVPFGRWVTRLTASCEEWNVAIVAHCILNQLNGVYTKMISSNLMFLFVSEVDYTLDESIWNEENPVGKY